MVKLNQTEEDRATMEIKRYEKLKAQRATFDSHMEEVAKYVMPRKQGITSTKTPGSKVTTELFDITAPLANQFMAAGFYGWLCPPNQKWFSLKSKNSELNDNEDVRRYWMKTTKRVHEELAASNFGLEINEVFIDMGWSGTACIHCEEGKRTALNFVTHDISQYVIAEDSEGRVDTVYRRFQYTARQAVQSWDLENMSEDVAAAYNSTEKDGKDKNFMFLHVVRPRADYNPNKLDVLELPVMSLYIDIKAKKIVNEDGYYEMPKMVPRFVKSTGETYGRSQSTLMLPLVKVTNKERQNLEVSAEKKVHPPIMAPDDGFIGGVKTTPGSIIYYRKSLQGKDKPYVFDMGGDIGIGLELIKHDQLTIKEGFFNDLFMMLNHLKDRQKTATEVIELVEEKLVMLGPVLGRIQSELFNPLVFRCVGVLGRGNKLEPVPSILIGQEYEVEYISKLALAMKLVEIGSFKAVVEDVMKIIEAKPEVLDNWDFDKVVRGIHERRGAPEEFLKPFEEVEAERDARAQAMEEQTRLEQAATMADAVPKLSQPIQDGSPLSELAGTEGANMMEELGAAA